jgi:hypothetical protein
MSEPYEVVVSVPEDPELTTQEKEALKESLKNSVLETLDSKNIEREVELQLITGGGGGS